MSSETVSDKRLEELIGEATNWVRMPPDSSHAYVIEVWKSAKHAGDYLHVLSALTELKSLRAQHAETPAGCAEMAGEIYKIVAEEFINSGLYQWQDDHLEAEIAAHLKATKTLPVIAAKLAPLFTLLKRVPEVFSDRECVLHEGYCPGCTLLADIDAALGKGDADGGQLSQPKESEVQR